MFVSMAQTPSISAQPISGFTYTSQLSDTLPHLAGKYLGDEGHAASISAATTQVLGLTIPDPLSPGLTIFIPEAPLALATPTPPPPPPSAGPEPFGKIAFSFYNRALHRRVWEIDLINADGSGRWVLRWNEVSEPAISPDGTHLAFRGWSGFDTGHVLSVGPLSENDIGP